MQNEVVLCSTIDEVTSFTEIDNFFFFSFSDETLLVSNTSVHRKCQYYRPRGGSLFFWDKNNVKSHKPNIKGIFCLFFPSNDVVMTGRQWYRRRWTHYLRQKDVSEE